MLGAAGVSFGMLMSLQLGVVAILDSRLFRRAPAEGASRVGPIVWSIIALVITGPMLIMALVNLPGFFTMLQFVGDDPLFIVPAVIQTLVNIPLCVFIILGAISRFRKKAPAMSVLKLILGIVSLVMTVFSILTMAMYF